MWFRRIINMHLFFAKMHNSWLVTILLALCIFVWSMGQLHKEDEVVALPPIIDPTTECETSSINNVRSFVIYSGGEQRAKTLNQIVCQNNIVSKQFGKVLSYWGVSDSNTLRMLGNGKADLALVKENIMTALKAEQTHGYKKIAYYPNYQSYLLALNEKPQLTKQYLLDKTIGLLVYPTSRSGHILPKQLITKLGLSLSKMDIVYASSHSELRELLIEGKVDIISSYWKVEDSERFSKNYAVSIADSVSGSAWYLKLAKQNDDLMCAARAFLKDFATQHSSSYYKNLKLVPSSQCDDVSPSATDRLESIDE